VNREKFTLLYRLEVTVCRASTKIQYRPKHLDCFTNIVLVDVKLSFSRQYTPTVLTQNGLPIVLLSTLLVRRSRDRFTVVSLDFSVTYSFRPYHGPGVDSSPSDNEYQEHFPGVKAAAA